MRSRRDPPSAVPIPLQYTGKFEACAKQFEEIQKIQMIRTKILAMSMTKLSSLLSIHRLLTISLCSLLLCFFSPAAANAENLGIETDPVKVQAIAKEATIWAYPMVENYQSMYNLTIDSTSSNYVGPMNQINNVPRV